MIYSNVEAMALPNVFAGIQLKTLDKTQKISLGIFLLLLLSLPLAIIAALTPANYRSRAASVASTDFGNAIAFSADNHSYIKVKNTNSIGKFSNVTMEAWVWLQEKTGAEGYPIISKRFLGGASGDAFAYSLEITPQRKVHFTYSVWYNNRWAATEMISTGTVSFNSWAHIALVYNQVPLSVDQNKLVIFINGNRDAETMQTGEIGGGGERVGDDVLIGTDPSMSYSFNGHMDEVRISSTPRYIGQTFYPPIPFAFNSDTLALFHFNETNGNPVGESSTLGSLETIANNIGYQRNLLAVAEPPTPTPTPTTISTPTLTPTPVIRSCSTFQEIGLYVRAVYYGKVYNEVGNFVPQGTQIKAYSPRGELVGCGSALNAPGMLAYMNVWGTDPGMSFQGMNNGEEVTFNINDKKAVVEPQIFWKQDEWKEIVLKLPGVPTVTLTPTTTPTPTPTITIVLSPSNTNVVDNIIRDTSNPSGSSYGNGFDLTTSADTIWQLYNSQDATYTAPNGQPQPLTAQGFGFYESSGSIGPGQTVHIRSYVSNNRSLGTYRGSYTLQQIYKGTTSNVAKIYYTLIITDPSTPTPTPVPNQNPVITTTSLPNGRFLRPYSVSITGYDPDLADILTIKVSNLPTGLRQGNCANQANQISCVITGRPLRLGTFNVKIELRDNRGGSTQKTLSLKITL